MSGETSKSIGEIGEKLAVDFLDKLGWEFVKGSVDIEFESTRIVDVEGKPKPKHGIDGIYRYFDNYQNRFVYVVVSAKNLSWYRNATNKDLKSSGAIASQISDFALELNGRVGIAKMAPDFRLKASIPESEPFDVVGLLVYYVHQGFDEDKYIEVLKKISLPRNPDFEETIYSLSNSDLNKIQSMLHQIERKSNTGDSLQVNCPTTDLHTQVAPWADAFTLPQLFSMWSFVRASDKSFVFYLGDTDGASIDYFISSLAHFQIFRVSAITIFIYRKQKLGDPELKAKWEGRTIKSGDHQTELTVENLQSSPVEWPAR